MKLNGRIELANHLRSPSQIARVITEDWCANEMYCPACVSDRICRTRAGSPACDFTCPSCSERFELKSCKHPFGMRIPDSGYGAMIAAIQDDRTPNLLALHYSDSFQVLNLFAIPRYFITEASIERRPPLSPNARRAGWIGCNILLHHVANHGKISIVVNRTELPRAEVRTYFQQSKSLKQLAVPDRGWTLDVLNALAMFEGKEFSLKQAYAFETSLSRLHPNNRNIRPKIRQQLQVLRDLGFLEFREKGRYMLRQTSGIN